MITKRIGNDIVPAIGQGTFGIGGYHTADYSKDDHYIECLRYGFDLGMTLVDTAENYAEGHTEELVGRAMKGYDRSELFICTKVSPEHLSYSEVCYAFERSLKRLKTDYIDLYLVHWPNPAISIGNTMRAMRILQENGCVHNIGVSNFSLREIKEAEEHVRIDAVQAEYNVFDRTVEDDILPHCQEKNIAFIAYRPLDTGTQERDAEKSLQWLLSHDKVIAIPKSGDKEHIRNNALVQCWDYSMGVIATIPVEKIGVDPLGEDNFCPSVESLSNSLIKGDRLKPIRIVYAGDDKYRLVEGKLRYYAWKEAFGDKPIPCLVRSD